MRVLITGADGFIGSHLTEHLIQEGYEVRAFVYYNSFNSWGWLDQSEATLKDQIEIFSGDIRDPNGVRVAMQNCDAVIHLAALVSIPYSYHSPDSYIETNVKGTLNVVQSARELGIERIIHTSTSEVYGTAKFVPITEDHPLQGQSPYSASKIGADYIAKSFFYSFDTPVTILRPFNTYGPRQSARAVIPTIITQIVNSDTTIATPEVRLGSLTPTRDFNFVKDTVRGFSAALKSDRGFGEVINIGSNYEVTIAEVAEIIAEVMNTQIQIITDDVRLRPDNSEVERLQASNKKADDLLNWQPKFGGKEGLRKGIEKTVEWFSRPENIKRYKSSIYNI